MSQVRKAAVCWILALLIAGLGVFCWVKSSFTSNTIESMITFGAGCVGVGTSFVLALVGLILIRQIFLVLVLVNLVVFIAAPMFLIRDEYIVHEDALANFITRTHWELVFAVLAVSVLISVALYLILGKWRKTEGVHGNSSSVG